MYKMYMKRTALLFTALMALFLLMPLAAGATVPSTWTSTNTFPLLKNLNAVTDDGTTFIAVGNVYTVTTSPVTRDAAVLISGDGLNWVVTPTGLTLAKNLNGIASSGVGKFVAVGDSGTMIYTLNSGANWTAVQPKVAQSLRAVTYGNGTYVAVGDTGRLVYSYDDGLTWTVATSPAAINLTGVAYGARFVAVGSSGAAMVSDDAVNWTRIATGFSYSMNAITYGDGRYFAVANGGKIIITTDGISWSSLTSPVTSALRGVGFGNVGGIKRWVIVGDNGKAFRLDDYGIWTPITTGLTVPPLTSGAVPLRAVAHSAAGVFYAAGNNGVVVSALDANPNEWPVRTWNTGHLTAAIYANGLYVTAGTNGTILSSLDGTTWMSTGVGTIPIPGKSGITFATIEGLAFGNVNTYVAVGDYGVVYTSVDGALTWQDQVSGVTTNLYGVAYGAGLFVAVGITGNTSAPGVILTSADGITWAAPFPASAELYGITYAAGQFVAVGKRVVYPSTNGTVWTSQAIAGVFQAVAYGTGTFVAVGNGGVTYTWDGVAAAWTKQASKTSANLYGITYGGNFFVAVGSGGTIRTCVGNGITWAGQKSGTSYYLEGVALGANNTFVTVGNYSIILQSNVVVP
jgi:hypothetical protein